MRTFKLLSKILTLGAAAGALAIGGLVSQANANVVEVHFSGLPLSYTGGSTITSGGGVGFDTATFFFNSNVVGVITGPGNEGFVSLGGITGIPETGGTSATSGSGIFDLSFDTGHFLWLDLFDVQVFYTGGEIAVTATSDNVSIFSQDLPFGLQFVPGTDLVVSFDGPVSNVMASGGFLTSFDVDTATGQTVGSGIPEPASMGLLGLAALCLVRRRRA